MTPARKYMVPIPGQYYQYLDTRVHQYLDTRVHQWLNKTTSSAKIRQLKLFSHVNLHSDSVLS